MLGKALERYEGRDALVLAVPRGGVVVGAAVAEHIGCELDLVVARKLGAPLNPELAVGAVAADGVPYLDHDLAGRLGMTAAQIAAEVKMQAAEVQRRELAYRGVRPPPALADRIAIVVDDGVATGATLRVALAAARRQGPAELCCAVPVGPAETLDRLGEDADDVVCPLRPRTFMAVGQWYRDFRQTGDDEVGAILAAAWGTG